MTIARHPLSDQHVPPQVVAQRELRCDPTSGRTVHGLSDQGHPVVRYGDGRWFIEPPRESDSPAVASDEEHAGLAVATGTWFAGRPQGARFDDIVRAHRGAPVATSTEGATR